MDIRCFELEDNRILGCAALEIQSVPAAEPTNPKESVAENARQFTQLLGELHKLCLANGIMAEMLWVTEKADRQVFKSRIRLYFIIRQISASRQQLETSLGSVCAYIVSSLSALRYHVGQTAIDEAGFASALQSVDCGTMLSVIKGEKYSANMMSPFPYYYTEVIPHKNRDNFEGLIAAMSQTENTAVSFQLFPTLINEREAVMLNEASAELGRITAGIFDGRQMLRDTSAAEPNKVLSYYHERSRSPLFQYNILVFGGRADSVAVAAKIVSLLQAGEERVAAAPDFGCMDLSAEKIDLRKHIVFYPWNINARQVHTYRNTQLLQNLPMAGPLFRLPYIVTGEEAAAFFRLPLYTHLTPAIKENKAAQAVEHFDSDVVNRDNIVLGTLAGSMNEVVIACPEKAFTKHALIVGTPGSGKTTFSINLLMQFAKRGIPFLAIEPTKTEYRGMIDAIPELQVFSPGNSTVAPFIINPFIPPKEVRVEQYIPSLASAFKAAFSMPAPLDMVFLKAGRTCYTEYGWKDYSRFGDPDVIVFGLFEFILVFKKLIAATNYSKDVKGNIESGGLLRLMNLIDQNSNIYDTIHTVPLEDILNKPTVLELNAIDNAEQKSLIMALLLINICVYTKHNQAGDGLLKNAILIDEAHVLLGAPPASHGPEGADSQATTIKALQDMIAEIRSYGTSILIADQSPTKVSREVVANTDIKVAFRLVQAAEKSLIADSTGMDDYAQQQLSKLKTGEAYVYYSKLDLAQRVVTEDIREKEGIRLSVSNDEVAGRITYWQGHMQLLKPYAECALCAPCRDGCAFNVRSMANYYSSRICDEFSGRIADSETLFKYVLKLHVLIVLYEQQNPDKKELTRLCHCTKIQFLRKMLLGKSFKMSRAEIRNLLTSAFADMSAGQSAGGDKTQ